jgi:hypothetical protein
MAVSASIPYPELNRPEIAITGPSGCSRFSSAITTRLDDGAGGFEVASHGPANRGSAAVRRESGVFDELHKNRKWKKFLQGFFDVYGAAHSRNRGRQFSPGHYA